ncbi:hypothetical protein KL936_002373 [Ogataea polymorpha]|nr:hypothetical protein KL936_002373 [Ogataea polymorpha]
MSSFLGLGGSKSNSGAGSSLSTVQTQQVKDQVKSSIATEMATAYATSLVNSLTENCFDKCILQPSSSLTSVEENCINDCASKFMRSWNLISKSYIARINNP